MRQVHPNVQLFAGHYTREPKTKLVANKLIDLFSKLQNQALWNYEQPKPVSPKVMQRLCQLA
jgi:hypothetical protein